MASGQVKFFIHCEDCSKREECGQIFSPGCCNWAGYQKKLKEDISEGSSKVSGNKG